MPMVMTFEVEYEDGVSQRVRVDQRDMVVFERAYKIGWNRSQDEMQMIALRHVAFSALQRTGALPAQYANRAQWEAACVGVDGVEETEQVTGEADPTNPEAPYTPSS